MFLLFVDLRINVCVRCLDLNVWACLHSLSMYVYWRIERLIRWPCHVFVCFRSSILGPVSYGRLVDGLQHFYGCVVFVLLWCLLLQLLLLLLFSLFFLHWLFFSLILFFVLFFRSIAKRSGVIVMFGLVWTFQSKQLSVRTFSQSFSFFIMKVA